MTESLVPLEPESCYHVYNHAVGSENIFLTEKNYVSFLLSFKSYILPYADLLCYCLMPNHFHLIVRFKTLEEISSVIKKLNDSKGFPHKRALTPEEITLYLSQQFSNYFNSYAKAFNNENYRRGTLFKRAFRRKPILSSEYMTR